MMASQQLGNFRKCADPKTCSVSDFYNPWTFHKLLLQKPLRVIKWLMREGLIASEKVCEECNRQCKLKRRKGKHHGYRWRCRQKDGENRHDKEYALTANSFFRGSKFEFQDILLFIRNMLLQTSLRSNAKQCGMDYKRMAVDWANFVRDLFKKYVDEIYNENEPMRLSGEVEIDESLFGRRCKYNRGNPNVGMKVWVVGLVERSTNRLILYPVEDRTEKTLLAIIERHVEKGSTIYTDGWAGYTSLNSRGYRHFSVVHKEAFKATYENGATGERVEVCTNRIEGAWKHSKDHFKRINGTTVSNFEAHMAEIIWRNHVSRKNIFQSFFELMRRNYTLTTPPDLETRSPLFDTWSVSNADTTISRMSDVEDDEVDDDDECNMSPPPVPVASSTPRRGQKRPRIRPGSSSKSRCCPAGFTPTTTKDVKRRKTGSENPYTKRAFVTLSSDSDFE